MTGFAYQPQTITVTVGTTILWINQDNTVHTVNADDNSFSSGNIPHGANYTHVFSTVGTVGYHCFYHGGPGTGMYGTVIVVSSARQNDY